MGNDDYRGVMDWDDIFSTCPKSMSIGRFMRMRAILVLCIRDNSLWSRCSWFTIRSHTIMWKWWWSGRTMISRYSCGVTSLRMISIRLTWNRTSRELVVVVNMTLRLWVNSFSGHWQLSLDLFPWLDRSFEHVARPWTDLPWGILSLINSGTAWGQSLWPFEPYMINVTKDQFLL